MMQVSVNDDLCVGCGLCAELCPEVFWMKNDFAKVKDNGIQTEQVEQQCLQTALECPTTAIQIKP